VSGIKSRDFKNRCEGALDDIASVDGDPSAGRAAGKSESLLQMVRGARWPSLTVLSDIVVISDHEV
jgi:hypothetical protein